MGLLSLLIVHWEIVQIDNDTPLCILFNIPEQLAIKPIVRNPELN